LKSSSHSDESGLVEVVVDISDLLKLAAQDEAKRVGQSLEQWLTNALTAALAEDLNGEDARG
jgi:predicted HicB family RNase H-like nuclease